ncbi:long-chain fatty acid transport protein [Sulfuricella denitrificans skB26]|uniref:Long-chain fatty acid transport protein n=1 Tax=Sulfuricella denitrificans (strain DSM 22764 / NBRC 105220 / skB26) TaxID=1163617 RepID=S6ABZ3_SULDS|nr:outer membrane protein transport protein [Sulfuricella denitrificans]BAN35133.1 long-chain fatty acid transport protein [Sulfuricella denitrificans skB26]
MSIKSNRLLAAAIVGLLSGSTSAFATNGSFMIGSGAGSIGMGGVGVTSPQDSMCVGGNPACLGEFIQPQFDIGAGLFRPVRAAGTTVMAGSGEYVDSEVNLYLLPSMGFVWPFNDQLTVGFAALPAGGGGVTFAPGSGLKAGEPAGNNFFSAENYLGTDLVQLIIPITAAYKVNETNTVGASIIPARQRFLAQGISTFKPFSASPDYLTNNGHDFANGLGARIGWMGYYFDRRVTLGATYATKVYMQKFEHYRGLFAERGSFDIPSNYAVGIGIKPVENLTVAVDVEKIQYSDVPAFANSGPDSSGNLNVGTTGTATALGAPEGAGFGWKDQTVYKLGVAYKPNDNWTLRAGYNYAKMPIRQEQVLFSVLATATSETHYTAGFTYSMGEQSILGFGSEGLITFAWMYAPNVRVEGKTVGPSLEAGLAGMQMRQQSWDLAYTLKF